MYGRSMEVASVPVPVQPRDTVVPAWTLAEGEKAELETAIVSPLLPVPSSAMQNSDLQPEKA